MAIYLTMFCGSTYNSRSRIVSGEAPKEPVVCKSNGILYEKRLIEQYVEEHGKVRCLPSD